MADLTPTTPVVRVQCMNPDCVDYEKVIQAPAVHLGENAYFVPPIHTVKCGSCDTYGPMNYLFANRAGS